MKIPSLPFTDQRLTRASQIIREQLGLVHSYADILKHKGMYMHTAVYSSPRHNTELRERIITETPGANLGNVDFAVCAQGLEGKMQRAQLLVVSNPLTAKHISIRTYRDQIEFKETDLLGNITTRQTPHLLATYLQNATSTLGWRA